jgi:branched-chain amino acid transport system permease protein
MVMSTIYLTRLVRSDFGLSIVALRDFENYAISRGIPRARQRFLTFITSSLFTGFAGAIFALYSGVVVIELFSFGYLTTLLSMVILGGVSTIYGPMIGAFILSLLSEFLETLGSWQYLIIAVATVMVLIYYPGGIYTAVKKGLGRFFGMS